MTDNIKIIAGRIRKLREEEGYTQTEMADKLNLTVSSPKIRYIQKYKILDFQFL